MNVDGKVLIASTAFPYIRANFLTAGPGIGIVNGPGTIQISNTSGGFIWNVVISATNPNGLVAENGYIAKGAGVVHFLLPAAANVGDTFQIAGYGNLWVLNQNALQSIFLGNHTTSVGVGGSLTATHIKDTVELVCVTANSEFQVLDSIGNITVI
jgi:hypothetical protein